MGEEIRLLLLKYMRRARANAVSNEAVDEVDRCIAWLSTTVTKITDKRLDNTENKRINVTARKRGRPRKDDALSVAERAKRYRARKRGE